MVLEFISLELRKVLEISQSETQALFLIPAHALDQDLTSLCPGTFLSLFRSFSQRAGSNRSVGDSGLVPESELAVCTQEPLRTSLVFFQVLGEPGKPLVPAPPPTLPVQCWCYGNAWFCLALYIDTEDLNSGLHACTASTLTHCIISPIQRPDVSMQRYC